jgi:putative ABC transport system substrate-binding protein
MNRREFIAGLGGAAGWSLAARAQQRDRVRRNGVLMPFDENDPAIKPRVSAFTQALAGLGWTDGRNVRMEPIPIVFASVADPVANGIVPRLNQPGGNTTGFADLEATLGGLRVREPPPRPERRGSP